MPTPGSLVGVVGVAHVASGNITGVFGQTPTAGNTLVCLCINHAGTASSSVPTRTTPGSWSLLPTAITNSLTADKQAAGAYMYGPAVGGGSDVAPTFTVANGGGGSTCLIFEFYGVVNFMDANGTKAAVATASTGATRTTGNLVPTLANDLDIAFLVMTSGGTSVAYTWNNGFASLYNEPINSNTISASIGTLVVTSNAAVTPSCTFAVTGGTALGTMMLSFALQLSITAGATVVLSGSGSASGGGTAAGLVTLSGSAAASTSTVGSGSVTLSGSAGAAAATSGAGTISLSGTGSVGAAPSAAGSVTLSGTGTVQARGVGAGSITVTGVATAQATATSSGAVTLTGTGTAIQVTGATGSLTLTGTAAGAVSTSASGSVTLTGAGTGAAPIVTSGTVTLTGLAAATGSGAGSAAVTLTANAAAKGSASPAASITLTGNATFDPSAIASAGSVTLTGASTASEAVTGTATITLTGAGVITGSPTGVGAIELAGTATASGTPSRDITIRTGQPVTSFHAPDMVTAVRYITGDPVTGYRTAQAVE